MHQFDYEQTFSNYMHLFLVYLVIINYDMCLCIQWTNDSIV